MAGAWPRYDRSIFKVQCILESWYDRGIATVWQRHGGGKAEASMVLKGHGDGMKRDILKVWRRYDRGIFKVQCILEEWPRYDKGMASLALIYTCLLIFPGV